MAEPSTIAEAADVSTIESRAAAQAVSAANNPSKQDVLNWLTAQKNGCEMRVGQHIGHGYGTTAGYQELVLDLEQQTGRRRLVEADYFDWDYAEDVVAFNQPLKEHWNAGA